MSEIRRLAREIVRVQQDVRALSLAPRLSNASFEDTAIEGYTEGNLSLVVGSQFDGANGAVPLTGPTPPAPSPATVSPSVGGLTVHWDGTFTNDGVTDIMLTAPTDFSRVEVHASTDPLFEPLFAETLVGTIETPRGTEVPVSLPLGTYYVRLVTRTVPGKASTPSDPVEGVALPIEGSRLAADAIDGKMITGATIRSNDSASRFGGWQLDSLGIRAWAPGDGVTTQPPTFYLNKDTGNLIATGTFQTATSGSRVKLSDRDNIAAIDMYANSGQAHGAIYTSVPQSGVDQSTFRHYYSISDWSYQYAITPNTWIIGSPSGSMIQGVKDGATEYIQSNSIFGREYTAAANVVITSNGILGLSTSKRANKLDIEPVPEDVVDKLLSLDLVTWHDRTESEEAAKLEEATGEPAPTLRRIPGMIAEDVAEAGLDEFVVYGEGGTVEGIMYDRLGVALIPLVARQRQRIVALEALTADLLRRVEALESAGEAG